jgi:hypothetical protein
VTYRPFPDRERALRQLARHHHAPQVVVQLPPMPRLPSPEQATRAVEAAGAALQPFFDAADRAFGAYAERVQRMGPVVPRARVVAYEPEGWAP